MLSESFRFKGAVPKFINFEVWKNENVVEIFRVIIIFQ